MFSEKYQYNEKTKKCNNSLGSYLPNYYFDYVGFRRNLIRIAHLFEDLSPNAHIGACHGLYFDSILDQSFQQTKYR